MNESLKPYLDAILQERSWSWSLIAIVYLLIGFMIQMRFLKPARKLLKEIDQPLRGEITSTYRIHSLWAWLFFLIPLVMLILVWYFGLNIFQFQYHEWIIPALLALSYLLSIILHLQAFSVAALTGARNLQRKHHERGY